MDTITTIPSLLKSNGSAQPVMVALTPNESRLIAVAPELLWALQFIERELRQHTEHSLRNNPVMYALNRARAAIAKAEGREP